MNDDLQVALPLKRFLLVEHCPAEWKSLDLYLFRDETVVFYVGQSQLAFARVWEHLKGGFHGHSLVGRFVTPLPPGYRAPNASLSGGRSLRRLIRAAERAVKEEERSGDW